jgi:hypothetical protein
MVAATSHNGWITAAIGPTGAIVVIVALVFALARVLLASAAPADKRLAVERWVGALSYPLAALAVAVIVVRFGQLAV